MVPSYIKVININPYEPTSLETENENGSSRAALYVFCIFATVLLVIAATGIRGMVGLQIVGVFGAAFVALLPLVVFAMIRDRRWRAYVGHATIAGGIVLTAHVALTASMVELLLRDPFLTDLVPFDEIVASTLNIVVPGSVVGFLLATLSPLQHKRVLWVGGLLLAIGIAAAIVYGQYFFGTLLEDRLAPNVWWL